MPNLPQHLKGYQRLSIGVIGRAMADAQTVPEAAAFLTQDSIWFEWLVLSPFSPEQVAAMTPLAASFWTATQRAGLDAS